MDDTVDCDAYSKRYLAELSRYVTPVVFDAWFCDVLVEEKNEDSVTLSTQSKLKRDTIDQRYKGVLLKAWSDVYGPVKSFKIVTRERLASDAARVNALAPRAAAGFAGSVRKGDQAASAFTSFTTKKSLQTGRDGSALSEFLSPLDERATFDRFAVDESNRIAFAAARQMFVDGGAAELTYIYGPSGVGKTHLLQAAGNEYRAQNGGKGCAYFSHHAFKNACVNAVFSNGVPALQNDLTRYGVVLIDDIHLLAGATRTQSETLNLVNRLLPAGVHVIVAGDCAPQKLAAMKFNARLTDRMSGGISVPISPGGEQLRCEVLKKRVRAAGAKCDVTDEAVAYIAAHFPHSMRETLGALNQIMLVFGGEAVTIGAPEAAAALRSRLGQTRRKPTLPETADAAAAAFSISVDELKGRSHRQRFARARHAYVLIAREVVGESFPCIARLLSRDHTTAMASYDRAQALMEHDKTFAAAVGDMRLALGLIAE